MDDKIIEAIENKNLIKCVYHGLDREAEPHVFGWQNGIKQVLVYQIRGQSHSGGLPEWRRFDLDEIINLQIMEERFSGQRPYPSGQHSDWDQIIAIVK